jgi:hypothetical protein
MSVGFKNKIQAFISIDSNMYNYFHKIHVHMTVLVKHGEIKHAATVKCYEIKISVLALMYI